MAERFFTKVANDVLAASEQLSNRLEDGIAAILNGDLALKQKEDGSGAGSSSGSVPPQYEHEFDDQFEILEEELRHNPLQGIAESVVGDIMGGQVRFSMSSLIGGDLANPLSSLATLERCPHISISTFSACAYLSTVSYNIHSPDLKPLENTWTPFDRPLHGQNPLFWHWQRFNLSCSSSVCLHHVKTRDFRFALYSW
jgi:hypothetical protein